jgi:hypothetical protein
MTAPHDINTAVRFLHELYYGVGACCSASNFANVRSSVMMPPAVSRGTASSPSRSYSEADDGSCGTSPPRLFSTNARASQSTLASRPCLWYSQLISDSSEPSGTSSARRTKPRERTYAFSLYSRLLMMPSSVPRSLSYAGSQNQLFFFFNHATPRIQSPRIESEKRISIMRADWVLTVL